MTPKRISKPTNKARNISSTKRASRSNFTRRTVAYRTLKQLFDTGELTGMESPSAVYNMDNVFKKYNIDQFRTGYNNFKGDFMARNGHDIQALNIRSTEDEVSQDGEDKKKESDDVKEEEGLDQSIHSIQEEDVEAVASYWGANYVMSHWLEPSTSIARINVAVLLPSGTSEKSFKVSVLSHGRILEVSIILPKPLLDMNILHKYFHSKPSLFNQAEVSLAINGFEKSLKTRKEHVQSAITNTTQIILPIKVSTDFTYHYLGWQSDSSMVVYVKLHSHRDAYSHVHNTQQIECV